MRLKPLPVYVELLEQSHQRAFGKLAMLYDCIAASNINHRMAAFAARWVKIEVLVRPPRVAPGASDELSAVHAGRIIAPLCRDARRPQRSALMKRLQSFSSPPIVSGHFSGKTRIFVHSSGFSVKFDMRRDYTENRLGRGLCAFAQVGRGYRRSLLSHLSENRPIPQISHPLAPIVPDAKSDTLRRADLSDYSARLGTKAGLRL